jgi:thiol-disulfide isomerase/thioredoxin
VWLFVSINTLPSVHSFAPNPTVYTLSSRNTIQTPQPQLYAVASPPAAEEEKEKKRNDTDSDDDADDWTPSRGGFLPNLRKRRSKVIQEAITMEDYKTVVVDEQDKVVVVRFFAPWCRACKAVAPLYEQLAFQYNSGKVKFVQVPLTKRNSHLHQGLGIPSLPFAHIYHPEVGLCEEMSMNKNKFSTFRDILETYIDGSCNVPQDYE